MALINWWTLYIGAKVDTDAATRMTSILHGLLVSIIAHVAVWSSNLDAASVPAHSCLTLNRRGTAAPRQTRVYPDTLAVVASV